MIRQIVSAVQIGNIEFISIDIEAADRAVIEDKPGSHPQGGLPPREFKHGAQQAHEKAPMTHKRNTVDQFALLVAVTGEKLRQYLIGAWLAFLVRFVRAVPPACCIQ